MSEFRNNIVELKKFFDMTMAEFKEEWAELSEEEKIWFKQQPLD